MKAGKISIILVVLMSFFICGCSTVSVSTSINKQQLTATEGTPIGNINVDIYGYYLFSVWPIFTGDPNNPNEWVWFEDTVTVDNAVKMLTTEAKKLGASKTVNLQTFYLSDWVCLSLISWCREVHASGNAVK